MNTVTIKDVARAAGVSPKTVSRVMNAEAHVRAPVREHVLRVVAELGLAHDARERCVPLVERMLFIFAEEEPRVA